VGGDLKVLRDNVQKMIKIKYRKGLSTPEIIAQFIVMEENENEVEEFKKYWLEQGATVKIRPKLGWGAAVESKVLDSMGEQTERFPCAWLTRTVSIHWDGSFSQCDADHDGLYSPGHLDSNSIKEVWDGKLAELRGRHWEGDFDFKPCNTCKDWMAGRSYFFYPEKG